MKRDQLSATIVKTGLIDDAFIILCAQYAFMESGHDKEHIRTIDVEWEAIDATFKTAKGTVVHLSTLFRRFQDYYNKRLKTLYDNGDKGTKHQAHHVSGEWETRFNAMEAKLDRTSNNVEQLQENQEELESAYHVGFRADTISHVPSAITTGDRVEKMMADGLALAIKELRRELVPTSNRTKKTPDDKT